VGKPFVVSALVIAGGLWFACGQGKSAKSTKKDVPESGTATGSETQTGEDAATDTASDTDTSTGMNEDIPNFTETNGIPCKKASDCALTFKDPTCWQKSLDAQASCAVEVTARTCCAGCECEFSETLHGMVTACVNDFCAALSYSPAADPASCKDPKPTDQGPVECVNLRCNNSGDLFKWMTPQAAAQEKALCKPCPEC
jgi:hypothetical protein